VTTAPASKTPPAAGARSRLAGLLEPHFLVAATLLALTAGGWNATIHFLQWATEKKSVPVPECVQVDPHEFRWRNMPSRMGPFVLTGDGELNTRNGQPEFDGRPDGEIVLEGDMLSALRIGSDLDRSRLKQRCSNWYGIGIYRDSREPNRLWRLEVYYYTGDVDKVPHVPERCLVAGGATLLDSTGLHFAAPQAPPPWDNTKFIRTLYQYTDSREGITRQAVQYYTFNFNGKTESSWKAVRLGLAYPWVHYCFFAKIQFAPLTPVTDAETTDRQAAEFARAFMPEVIRHLPTAADVAKLSGRGADAI